MYPIRICDAMCGIYMDSYVISFLVMMFRFMLICLLASCLLLKMVCLLLGISVKIIKTAKQTLFFRSAVSFGFKRNKFKFE